MSVPTFVYQVPEHLVPETVDGLEVLVRLVIDGNDLVPEVSMRPTLGGVGYRVWGPPLELTRAER